jgi:hypothetical protein
LILNIIDNSTNGDMIVELTEHWAGFHLDTFLPELITRITNNKEVGLIEDGYFVVKERYIGRLVPATHGRKDEYILFFEDDIYQVAGRANYFLKLITGKNFGDVKINTSLQELEMLKNKWVEWFDKRCRKTKVK